MGREKKKKEEQASDDWKANFAQVSLRKGRTVYRPNRNVELPALLQTQVIASRDPRLSPSLPNTSIYSRDFDFEDDDYTFEEEDSASFNSEDWYMDDVSDDFEEQAKKVKVKVHVNPKFLEKEVNKEVEKRKEKPAAGDGQEDGCKSKEKVQSWLQETVEDEESSPNKGAGRRSRETEKKKPGRIKESPSRNRDGSGSVRRSRDSDRRRPEMTPESPNRRRPEMTPESPNRRRPEMTPESPNRSREPGSVRSRESDRRRPDMTPDSPDRIHDRVRRRSPDSDRRGGHEIASDMTPDSPVKHKEMPVKKSRESDRIKREKQPSSPVRRGRDPMRKKPQMTPESPTKNFEEPVVRKDQPLERIRSPVDSARSTKETQKSIPMFPDDANTRNRSPSPMFKGSLFSHLQPLKTKDYGHDKFAERKTEDVPVKQESLPEKKAVDQRDFATPHLSRLQIATPRETSPKPLNLPSSQRPKPEVLPPSDQWTNKPKLPKSSCCRLRPLSGYAKRSVESDCLVRQGIIDRLIDSHRRDVFMELEQVCRGREHSKYDKAWKHLSSLSIETQLESTFSESAMAKRAYLASLREWMTTKPLDDLLANPRGTESVKKPLPIRSSLKTDATVKMCNDRFDAEIYYVTKGGKKQDPDQENVYPMPRNTSEETVDEVYRQVHQYMEFLNKKALQEQISSRPKAPIMPFTQAGIKPVPEPVQPPSVMPKRSQMSAEQVKSSHVPAGLAYSPSRPTEQDEEEDFEDGEIGKKRKGDSRASPSKKHKSEEKKKEKKNQKKHKKDKKKIKKAKKKRKDRKNEDSDDDPIEDLNQDPKSPESESSGSESPPSTRKYIETIESPTKEDRKPKFSEDRERKSSFGTEQKMNQYRFERGRERDRRDSDRYDRDREHFDDRRDPDRHDFGRGFSRRGYRHHSELFMARKNERERKVRCREVMRIALDRILNMKPQEETVLQTTLRTWKIMNEITHKEAIYVGKNLVEASKHLTRDFDPEKGFVWALVLAIHSQVMQDAQDEIAMEEATAAAAKAEQELEEGEIEESPAREVSKGKDDTVTKNKAAKAGGMGNKLLNAFRQQMAAKKQKELGIVNKVEVSKLSPAAAAKKPKPSSSKILFKPPAAFEMLKAAQEERTRQPHRRMGLDAKEEGPLKFDGVVREGLVADALKSFFNLTDDLLQTHSSELSDDFMEFVQPVALDTVNVVKQHLGLAATIVIVVKEKRDKEKQKGLLRKQQAGSKDEHSGDEDGSKTDNNGSDGESSTPGRPTVEPEPILQDAEKPVESTGQKDDITVVDMEMDEEEVPVNEYGTVVNEYGTVVQKAEEIPKLKEPIKLMSTPKLVKKESVANAFGNDDNATGTKRKLETLSDDEDSAAKKTKEEELREKENQQKMSIDEISKDKMSIDEISKDKMVGMERIEFEDADANVVEQKLQRMQTGGGSSNKHVAAELISAIVSKGPTDAGEVKNKENEDEEGQLVFQRFTPVRGAPEPEPKKEDCKKEEKKTVVESVVSVKGKPVSTTAAPLPKSKSPAKQFKAKGWGTAPKTSCTSSQKVSAQDILNRLHSKAAASAPVPPVVEESKPAEPEAAVPLEPDENDLYHTALTIKNTEEATESSPPPSQEEEVPEQPPLPPTTEEPPPLPPIDPPIAPPIAPPIDPIAPKLITAKSAEEFSKGIVAQAAPQISKPPVNFPSLSLPDTSMPPPPLPGATESSSYPGEFQAYPPVAPDGATGSDQYSWGDYNQYNYNNHHWDGTQWVAGPAPWAQSGASWPPPTWQPPPASASGWPPPPPATSGSGSWWPQTHPPPWGSWPAHSTPETDQTTTTSTTTAAAPPTEPDWGDLPPGEEPPVQQMWPTWKPVQPTPPGVDPTPPGEDSIPGGGGSLADEPLKFANKQSDATHVPATPPKPAPKIKKEWKKPPFPIRPVLPLPNVMRMFVFNREKLMCRNVYTFLDDMGVDMFDPYNLACLTFISDVEAAAVLIHQDDIHCIHLIPNLAKLKQHPKVKFVTYFDANDVAMQKYSMVLPSGGMLIADDTVLLGLQPAALKEVCRFMLNAGKSKDKGKWGLMIHSHIMAKLNFRKHDINNTSQEVLRLTSLLETIEHFRGEGIVEILINHDCNSTDRPAHEYVHCCTKLQAQKSGSHRHVFLLSDVRMTSEKSNQFLEAGIGIISVPDFLQTYANKPIPAPMVAIPRPSYGKRSSALFDDSSLTSAAQEIELEKIPPETFKSLVALKTSLEKSATPRLGEVVRPDANVRPSEGRYDSNVAGPSRGGWLREDDGPPGT